MRNRRWASEPAIPFARSESADRAVPTVVPLGRLAPLRLDGGDGFWLVERGRIDLFAVRLDGGVPAGTRLPLCRVEEGELIAGMPSSAGRAVLAVGELDSAVLPVAAADFAKQAAAERAALLDGWFSTMAAAVFGALPGRPDLVATAGDRIDLTASRRLYAGSRPVWIAPQDGRMRIGDGPVVVTRAIPIAGGLSLCAIDDCTVEAIATIEALDRGGVRDGLDQFNSAILDGIATQLAVAEDAARGRVAGRSAADRHSIDRALRQLAAAAGNEPDTTEPGVGRDPLSAALEMVAAIQGIELRRVPRVEAGVGPPLQAIARVNGIGLREVLLRDGWWRGDNGPLLAFRGDAHSPVALLPGGRSYRLWDPAERTSTGVDARLAEEVAPKAVMLYRPAPERIAGVGALLRFAGRGIGRELATVAATAVLTGAVAMAVPLATGFLLDTAVPRTELGQVVTVIMALVLAGLAAGVFDLTKAVALLRLEARLETALQPAVMHRLFLLPVNFFRGFGTGELTNRVLSIQTMRQLLAGNGLAAVLSAIFAAGSLAVILLQSPLLALLSAGLVLVAALATGGLAIAELHQERARVALRGQEDDLVVQAIQAIPKLRVAAAETRIFAQWASLFSRQKRHFRLRRRYAVLAEGIAEVYPIVAILVLYFAATRLLNVGDRLSPALGLGAFLAINAAFGQLLAATMALARSVAATLEIIPLFERLRPIAAAVPEAIGDKLEPAPLAGRIELNQVSFRYAEGAPLVIEDLSLTIEAGQFVAVVGPSGSGKSTMLRLLLGFERAERGDILYDGQSISALDTAALRRQIGVVLQAGRIATGSIFENITGGLPYTLDDAWEAVRLAGVDDDIEALPMGMHTLLMEGSSTLSGGQRQRLMIARALIGHPRILLFDEATSALDNRSQAVVTKSMARLRATRIVIAHRLSTVQLADRIFVIERGRLVESGSFDELAGVGGPFSRLVSRQIL